MTTSDGMRAPSIMNSPVEEREATIASLRKEGYLTMKEWLRQGLVPVLPFQLPPDESMAAQRLPVRHPLATMRHASRSDTIAWFRDSGDRYRHDHLSLPTDVGSACHNELLNPCIATLIATSGWEAQLARCSDGAMNI